MIAITGDIHGPRAVPRFFPQNIISETSTMPDVFITLGDFGIVWHPYPNSDEIAAINALDELPYPILSVLGNHENFERINQLPVIDLYGGNVRKVSANVFFLQHGESYLIDNRRFLVFGGGLSIDKNRRTQYVDWWPEEIPSAADLRKAAETVKKHNGKFDYVLTHTAPEEAAQEMMRLCGMEDLEKDDPTERMLSEIAHTVTCKRWFFGHYHDDYDFRYGDHQYTMLYEGVRFI
jgi:hypothetical protein